ncbi:helix-turn-helix domain-containing protein [Oscillibacter sp.]|uniref:helix-turn-helix domain-containing protein n=1 Tax=Oscillibacter sp. TaxID=1945593 RepID=UPI002D7F19E0|nr:helix-turn-helix transcriptional regulator [Oscillibacter sp.]
MSFSENLQFLRSQAGVTQEQLAEQLDVTRQSVSKWESAQSFPEMDTLLRICDLYDVNLDTLLRGSVEASRTADTAKYDAFINRFAWRISLATAAIIAAVGLCGLMEVLGLPEALAGAALLLVITVCVVVFVVSGIEYADFRKKNPLITDFYTEEQKESFQRKFVWHIAGGVGAVLFAVALLALFFSAFPEREPYESYAMAFFLLMVAGAVWSFIYGGILHDKYDVAAYNRDNDPTPEAKRRRELVSTVCAVIMLLATAVYVGLGLALRLWGTAWWVFAVGGILCGVAAVVLGPKEE